MTTARGLAALSALLFTALTSGVAAQERSALLVVVESGEAPLDVEALQAQLAEATGREVLGVCDARAPLAAEVLTLGRDPLGRWALRHQLGELVAWSAVEVEPAGELAALVEAGRALVVGAAQARDEAWPRLVVDLLDPFRGWDPLRAALRLQLVEPFATEAARSTSWVWLEIVDPFAPAPEAWSDVLDPWAG